MCNVYAGARKGAQNMMYEVVREARVKNEK